MRATFLLLVLVASSALPLGAQTAPPALTPGVRVRVVSTDPTRHASETLVQGALVRVSGDTVVVTENRLEEAAVLDGRRTLEVLAGEHRAWARGALFGTVAGAVLFGAMAAGSDCSPQDWVCVNNAGGVLGLGAAGGVVGLVVGTIIGGLTTQEEWVQARPSDVHVGIVAGGVGVSIAF